MKKIIKILTFLFFAGVTFWSCSKVGVTKDADMTSLSQATVQSINAGTITGIKQSYGLLMSDEKQALWEVKWNAILKNDAGKLTKEQTKIVTMIRDFVDQKTIASLTKDPAEGESFIKNNLPYFEKHFNTAELYMLIECSYFCDGFSIFKTMDYLATIDKKFNGMESSNMGDETIEGEGEGENKCTCYYSLYCSLGGGGGGTCDTEVKCTKNANCGLTGTSNCTGKCTG